MVSPGDGRRVMRLLDNTCGIDRCVDARDHLWVPGRVHLASKGYVGAVDGR